MKKVSLQLLVSNVLGGLSPRQKEVVESRYGLRGKGEMTLAEIGDSYGVTRERIRQIESLALSSLKNKLREDKDYQSFTGLLVDHITGLGGVRREDLLAEDVKKMVASDASDRSFSAKIKFLLEVSDRVHYHRDDPQYHPFWYLDGSAHEQAEAFVIKLAKVLEQEGDWQVEMRAPNAKNYLALSKIFGHNTYGDFGLIEWPHINPKTARDWAFLVLRKARKPLHFTELASAINKLRKGKVTNVQTVHNELIKDNRFVLLGRGVYGLNEFGLMSGTCREVIAKILKTHGPQGTRDVIKLVTAKRDFKENTLILNLQNKKYFARTGDGRYAVKEA